MMNKCDVVIFYKRTNNNFVEHKIFKNKNIKF